MYHYQDLNINLIKDIAKSKATQIAFLIQANATFAPDSLSFNQGSRFKVWSQPHMAKRPA
jgi:hypothetical protein